jgi:hypothetical protein
LASKQKPRPAGPPARATKAERKEQARRERIEIQRRMERARRNRTIAIAGIVIVGAAIVAGVALTSNGGETTGTAAPSRLTGLMTGPQPWSANLDTLDQRLREIQLPGFGNPLAVHEHSHLDLFVNGSSVAVPADIGFGPDAAASLHTHDTTGVVHLESNQADATFTLGEFFDVWGLRLTSSCIGGYCDSGDRTLRLFLDGKPYEGDPRSLELRDREEIVVTYGTNDEVPSPLPTFDWSTLQP